MLLFEFTVSIKDYVLLFSKPPHLQYELRSRCVPRSSTPRMIVILFHDCVLFNVIMCVISLAGDRLTSISVIWLLLVSITAKIIGMCLDTAGFTSPIYHPTDGTSAFCHGCYHEEQKILFNNKHEYNVTLSFMQHCQHTKHPGSKPSVPFSWNKFRRCISWNASPK